MSEYHQIDTEFKDEQCLIDALREMNYHPEVHKEATNLYGYQGDKRPEKAHIIIRRKEVGGSSNDVGFVKEGNKFKTIASGYDTDWRTGKKINKLKQVYGEKVIMKTISKNPKYFLISRKEEKGDIKIKVRRY